MPYLPTGDEIAAVKQYVKEVFVKVELLNHDFTIIDALTGNLISDSFSMDSESKQRRSYSCNLYVSDYSLTVGQHNKIWIDKYIRVYYGIKSMRRKEIIWWCLGTFTYLTANYSFSATDCTLSLSCADMMADYDGTKGGLIHQTKYDDITGESANGFKIPRVAEYKLDANGDYAYDSEGKRIVISYNKIRDSIEALVQHAGITNYQIEDYPDGEEGLIPYDLEYSGEVNYCQVWTDICELYPSWEFFFDTDGTFIWRKIPTGLDERVATDNSLIDPLYITESINNSFQGIYNVTEVWGKTFSLTNEDRYAQTSTYNASTNTYQIDIPLIAKSNATTGASDPLTYLVPGDRIAFKIFNTNTAASPKLVIKDSSKSITLTSLPIVDSGGKTIPAQKISAASTGTICVFTYRQNLGDTLTNCVYLNGQTQAYAIYEETSEEYPFSTTNLGYKIVRRITKDDLYSDDLCYNQAEYETYKTTALMDTVDLTMVIVPWLNVNEKVEYRSKITGNTEQYIIKNISWSTLDGTMTLNMYRFLEDFQYVYDRKYGGA